MRQRPTENFAALVLQPEKNDATIPMIKWNIRTEREPLVGGFFQLWRLESTNRKAFCEISSLTTFNTGQGKMDGDFQMFFDFLSLFAG